jgi:putative endonuclease
MYTVYVLRSIKTNRYYIGVTKDLINRLERHNSGSVRSTKAYRKWKVIYTEEYSNKKDAWRRELEVKKYKSGLKFNKLIGGVA